MEKLRKLSGFEHLSDQEMTDLISKSVNRTLSKDQFIFAFGDPSTSIFFLKKGRVKLGALSGDDKEMIKHIFVEGELFGLSSISNQKQRDNFTKALDNDTQIACINVFDLKHLMQNNIDFSLGLAKLMGDRIIEFQQKIESLMFKDTNTRVIELLRDFAKKQGIKVGDEILIKHNLTHQDFASLTATTRQTVTSIFSDLKKQDLVYMERGKILIRDLAGL